MSEQTTNSESRSENEILPVLPDVLKTNSTYRLVALELMERIPNALKKIKEGIEKKYHWQIKSAACDLSEVSFCGYETLASYLTQIQISAEAEDGESLEKIYPYLKDECLGVIAGKDLLKALIKNTSN